MNRTPILALVIGLAACTSPESTRVQGGGPGADTGNRKAVVMMHEGAQPYADTPQLIPTDHPPPAAARQASRLSQR